MKTGKSTRLVALLLLIAMLLLAAVSCKDDVTPPGPDDNGNNKPAPTAVKLTVALSATRISGDETVTATATVEGTDNKAVTWTISNTDMVKISDDGVISIVKSPKKDSFVKVTATSVADPTVSASRTLIVAAPRVEGRVGDLTSDMIAEIGNENITVTGTLTDIYVDYNNSFNNSENRYDILVKMSDGAWVGTWGVAGGENKITDNYRRGDDGYTNMNGDFGHALTKLYIDRHNEVSSSVVKDYMSIPTLWETQHLWNHLSSLNVNRFTYDIENDIYKYTLNVNDEADLYLMTYLSFCLTPMLSDTLSSLYLKVEDGKITKLSAQTEVLLYGGETDSTGNIKDPDAMSYTTFEVTFSDIGTTVVDEPEQYEAPDYAEKLEAALAKMQAANNYSYMTEDTQTYAASGDSGDYELSSLSGTALRARLNAQASAGFPYRNNTTSTGKVGEVGFITADAIVRAKTIKYTATLDGKDYRTEYTGVKQNANGTYDEFGYDSSVDGFVGTKNVSGSIADTLPGFDMSANIFEFTSVRTNTKTGTTLYTFTLRDSAIVREVAKQVATYNATSAEASSTVPFQIVVDNNGNVVSTTFPYSISGGIYAGYCTTTYKNIGTTAIDENAFTNYVPRVIKSEWSQYTVSRFYYLYTSDCSKYGCAGDHSKGNYDHSFWEATADKVLENVYGDEWTGVPAASVFMNIFGDNISGPFYSWKNVNPDENGDVINHSYMNITVTSSEYDDNMRITNYDEIANQLKVAMENCGFTLSQANSDTTGGETGRSDRYLTFIKGNIEIVIQNNGTRYFWIYFYKTGDWTLKKNTTA